DLAGGERFHRAVLERRVSAAQAGDEFGAVGEPLEHCAQRVSWLAPGDELVAEVGNRVAGMEAAAGIVAGGWRDRSGLDVRHRLTHALRVLARAETGGHNRRGRKTGLVGMRIDDVSRLPREVGRLSCRRERLRAI